MEPSIENCVRERYLDAPKGYDLAAKVEKELSSLGFEMILRVDRISQNEPIQSIRSYMNDKRTVVNSILYDKNLLSEAVKNRELCKCIPQAQIRLIVVPANDDEMMEIDEKLNDLYLGT